MCADLVRSGLLRGCVRVRAQCAVCCVLCAVCCVLCAVRGVLGARERVLCRCVAVAVACVAACAARTAGGRGSRLLGCCAPVRSTVAATTTHTMAAERKLEQAMMIAFLEARHRYGRDGGRSRSVGGCGWQGAWGRGQRVVVRRDRVCVCVCVRVRVACVRVFAGKGVRNS